MWVQRRLRTAEEELDGLDQPEESGNQVNVTCVTDDGVTGHVVPELVLSTAVSAGKPDFRNFMAPTLTDFDDMVRAAFTVLPKKYTHLCDAVMVQVKDFHDQETLEKVHSKNKFCVFGTFHGRAQFKAENQATGHLPNMISLYRYPVLYFLARRQVPLEAIITHVLVHEIGHHFGLSDEDMRVIEVRE
jgi:predicted Zn-dependent protease with MMP-like domain